MKNISYINHPRGSGNGFLIGGITGALAGYLAASILFGKTAAESSGAVIAYLLLPVGAGVGMLIVGPLIGGAIGHREEFQIR